MDVFRVSSNLSHTAARIELARRSDGDIVASAQATGFFWHRHDRLWLVTNLHNLAGWDFSRGKALSDVGFMPTEVQIRLSVRRKLDGDLYHLTRTSFSAQLSAEDGPRWLVHPREGPKIDVAVLSLGAASLLDLWPSEATEGAEVGTLPVNQIVDLVDFEVSAGDDAFVVGYPKGIDGGDEFPLWKRASLASEPSANIGGLPKVLVDTATRKGMSGSPVFAVRSGFITLKNGEQKIGRAPTFLGIYSGRLEDDPFGVQIGVVWKASVIDEIIDGLVRGKLPWEPLASG